MKKRLFILGLCAMFSFLLSSCGEDEGTDFYTEKQENAKYAPQK